MDVYERMKETIEQRNLIGEGDALLLMVSGGSDSTALAHLAAKLRDEGKLGALDMLHVNHKLRGKDADEDAEFVAQLAASLNIPLFACEIDIAGEAARSGENVEAVARRERYNAANEALMSMCQHEAIPLAQGRIVTAHTIDDRIENFYMRSIVGTGPGGFRSMLYQNGDVIRPLLDCSREELRDYLRQLAEAEGVEGTLASHELWREDATNAHTDRFRAYVRHEIVPRAREWNPHLDTTLGRTMNLIGDEDDMVDAMADDVLEEDALPLGDDGTPCDRRYDATGLAEDELHEEEPFTLADYANGFLLRPAFGYALVPLQRRVVRKLLQAMLGMGERIDASSVEAVLAAFDDNCSIISGYVANIQGDIAVSANKQGVRVEPMSAFRARRKRKGSSE